MTQKPRAPGFELVTSKLRRTQTDASTTSVTARCKRHTRDVRLGIVFLYESLQKETLFGTREIPLCVLDGAYFAAQNDPKSTTNVLTKMVSYVSHDRRHVRFRGE